MKIAKQSMIALAVVALGMGAGSLRAEQINTNTPLQHYGGYVSDRFDWVSATNLPEGASMALLQGSPQKAGPYTIRYQLPAGYRIPLNWNTTDQSITVISGLLNIGMAPNYDPSSSKTVGAGSFAFIPAKMRYVGWTDIDTVIQIHGIGPNAATKVFPPDP